jgi:hypothetical protein
VWSFDGTIVVLTDQQGNQVLDIGINEQLGQVSNRPHPFATTLMVLSPSGAAFIRTLHGWNAAPQQSQEQVTGCPQSSMLRGDEMATYRWVPPRGHWVTHLVAGFIFALCPLLGGWSNGEAPVADATRAETLARRPRISVQHGRLTVNLRDADVRQVIAEIGQLAGIPMILGPIPERKVSAEITDVDLEEGLLRLMKRAALNHTIPYAQGPAGKLVMKKVLVFETAPGGGSLPSTATESDREESPGDAGWRMLHAATQGQEALPAVDNAARPVMRYIREA